jgi:Protein of unknown function (DUF2510)
MSAPASWYPQPDGDQRYWDGELWTEEFAPDSPPVAPPAVIRKNWFLRHKVLIAVCAVLLLGMFTGLAIRGGTKSETAGLATPVPGASPRNTTEATNAKPAPAVTGPLTTQEVVWLSAVEKLEKQMEGVSAKVPANLTPGAMVTTADQMRECSRGLALQGPPGARLQPVYSLAAAGCKEFDIGAACLSTAAGIGVSGLSPVNDRRLTESLNCAVASLGNGTVRLGEGLMKGEQIKTAALR